MKRSISLITALILAVGMSFAGNVKKNYDVSNFTSIQLYGAPKLVVSEGNTVSVRVEGDEDLVKLYDVSVEGKTLIVKPKNKKQNNWGTNKKQIQFFVQMPKLSALTLLGSGDIIVNDNMTWESKSAVKLSGSGDIKLGRLNVSGFNLMLNGSGDVEVKSIKATSIDVELKGSGDVEVAELIVDKLSARVTGSGDIELRKGKSIYAEYKVTGSGDLTASGIESKEVKASIAGSGDVACYASQSISGSVAGSGTVSYKGKPSHVAVSKKGFRAM